MDYEPHVILSRRKSPFFPDKNRPFFPMSFRVPCRVPWVPWVQEMAELRSKAAKKLGALKHIQRARLQRGDRPDGVGWARELGQNRWWTVFFAPFLWGYRIYAGWKISHMHGHQRNIENEDPDIKVSLGNYTFQRNINRMRVGMIWTERIRHRTGAPPWHCQLRRDTCRGSTFFERKPLTSSASSLVFGRKVHQTKKHVINCNKTLRFAAEFTLWLFNIAMENGPFIDDFPS